MKLQKKKIMKDYENIKSYTLKIIEELFFKPYVFYNE